MKKVRGTYFLFPFDEMVVVTKPAALMCVTQESLKRHFDASESLREFAVTTLGDPMDLDASLSLSNFQLLILEVTEEAADVLSELDIPTSCNCIFLSEGTPIDALDQTMKAVAGYHFRAPLELEAIETAVQEFLLTIQSQNQTASDDLNSQLDQFGLLVGSADCMRELYRTIHRVAPSEASVFIVGESGTGKELVARTVHLMSERVGCPFVAVNCGAINAELADSDLFGHVKGAFTGAASDRAGMFERAQEGTLFLDEITEMPIDLQVKLLRVLETGELTPVGGEQPQKTNVRIIAASNRDPLEAIDQGRLREDLYFRLAQFPIGVPTLRSRGSDIEGLAEHFLTYLNEQENSQSSLSDSALRKIKRHPWPGNVRELKHTVHRAFLLGNEIIEADDVVFDAVLGGASIDDSLDVPAGVPLEEIEKAAIEKTLEQNQGNKTETADQLGISVKTLYNKLDKYQN